MLTRRQFVEAVGAAGAIVSAPFGTLAQTPQNPAVASPGAITPPPRDFGPNAPLTTYPDPDVVTVDPTFNRYTQRNTAITRLWTGGLWCEGPAWSGQGHYLV